METKPSHLFLKEAFKNRKFILTKYTIFLKTQKIVLIVAGLAAVPSVYLSFTVKGLPLGYVIMGLYLSLLLSHLFLRKYFHASVIILSSLLYLTGVVLILYTGVDSAGMIYVLMMPVLYAIFLGFYSFLTGLFIAFITFFSFGLLMYKGLLSWQIDWLLWLVITVNYMACISVICYIAYKLMVSLSLRMFNLDNLNSKLKQEKISLKETVVMKDMLLREIHHRVGNNLQIISSLVNLIEHDSPERREEDYQALKLRIKSISSVYFLLFSSAEDIIVELGALVEAIWLEICLMKEVTPFSCPFESNKPLCIKRDMAVSLALLINEYFLINAEMGFENFTMKAICGNNSVSLLFLNSLDNKHSEIGSLSSLLIDNLILQMQGSVSVKGEQVDLILPLSLFSQER